MDLTTWAPVETTWDGDIEKLAEMGWQDCTSVEVEPIDDADDKTWVLTSRDFSSTTDAAFAWNEWERQSLEAAAGDPVLEALIVAFWNDHCPVMMSVRSGYAYLAIEKGTLLIVEGDEPELEEARVVASSLLEALERAAPSEATTSRWA